MDIFYCAKETQISLQLRRYRIFSYFFRKWYCCDLTVMCEYNCRCYQRHYFKNKFHDLLADFLSSYGIICEVDIFKTASLFCLKLGQCQHSVPACLAANSNSSQFRSHGCFKQQLIQQIKFTTLPKLAYNQRKTSFNEVSVITQWMRH